MNEPAREYFWGVTLDKENPTITWSFDEEEDDTDFLIHTLFLKQGVNWQRNCCSRAIILKHLTITVFIANKVTALNFFKLLAIYGSPYFHGNQSISCRLLC
jgi:hypothetical protein